MRASDKKQVARIERIMVPWLRRLDLYNTWEVLVELVGEAALPKAADDEWVYAMVHVNSPYKRATISINREWAKGTDNVTLEHHLLHELVHVVVSPLVRAAVDHIPEAAEDYFRDAHEGVTDTVANLLLWDAKGKRQHGTTSGRS